MKNNSLYTENVEIDAKIPDIDTKRVDNVVKALGLLIESLTI